MATGRPSRRCSRRSPPATPSELWCLGDLVGYGADPDICVELAREHAAVCLAGNHDLAVAGRDPARRVLPRGEPRGAVDPGGDRAREPRLPRRAAPARAGGLDRPLPRQPARPRVGVRALGAARRAVPGPPARPHLPDRPFARGALVRAPRGRARHRRAAARGRAARPLQRRMAAEPRQRRAAARRRPARLLAAAGPRRPDAPPSGAPTTTSPAPPARSARRVCRTRSPSAWSTVSDRESHRSRHRTHVPGQCGLRLLAGRPARRLRRRCSSPAGAPARA